MRTLTFFLMLAWASCGWGFPYLEPARGPRTFAKEPTHPDEAVKECLIFLEMKVDPRYWPCYRFFHFLPFGEDDLYEEVYNFHAALPTVSSGQVPYRPVRVDKAGKVWAVDIREVGWTPEAFRSVTRIEKTCRVPHVDFYLAEELRRAVGVEQDPKTFHCEGLIPGSWFTREILEPNLRKDDADRAYYNLLYARERFGDYAYKPRRKAPAAWKDYEAEVTVESGYVGDDTGKPVVTLQRGAVVRVLGYEKGDSGNRLARVATSGGRRGLFRADWLKPTGPVPQSEEGDAPDRSSSSSKVIRDFPRDIDDWNRKWGVDVVDKYLAEERIFKRYGAVVGGGHNMIRGGSIVSYNDRVIAFLRGGSGQVFRTWDFERTSGEGNVANRPKQVAVGDLQEAAGEDIAEKADGYPAWMLHNGAVAGRKRVELGLSTLVHSSLDQSQVTVLTQVSCIICHGKENVVLAPSNKKLVDALKRAIDLEVYTREERQQVEAFFVGWDDYLDGWRRPFAKSLAKVTTNQRDPDGWTWSKWSKVVQRRRDYYDAPVTLDQAAAEFGATRLSLMLVCLIEGSIDAQNLFLDDEPIPRAVWDDDLFPRLAYIYAMARDADDPDPLFVVFAPEEIRPFDLYKGGYLKGRR